MQKLVLEIRAITPGSQSQKGENSTNMVINVGPGTSCLSWLARVSADGWEIESPNHVPGGTAVQVGESIMGWDSSNRTPRQQTLELAVRIGCRLLRILVD